MAGSYPDPPDHRIPWDLDGTVGLWLDQAWIFKYELSQAMASLLNSQQGDRHSPNPDDRLGLIFPRLLDITGLMVHMETAGNLLVQWSPDTTNITDGTWNTLYDGPVPGPPGQLDPPDTTVLRTDIKNVAASGVRAIRLAIPGTQWFDQLRNLHIYGAPSAGQDQQDLQIVEQAVDERIDPVSLDLADVPRFTSRDIQFRVKNRSNMDASNIVVSAEVLAGADTDLTTQHNLSLDGATFTPTVTIPALASGALSDVIVLRQSLDNTTDYGLQSGRIIATAGAWA